MREAFVTLTEYLWLFSIPYYSYKLPWYLIDMVQYMTWYHEFLDSWAFGAYLMEISSHTCIMRDAFVTLTEYL